MASKAPFILTLIGVILGFFNSAMGIVNYFIFSRMDEGFFSQFAGFGIDLGGLLLWSLISSIAGIVMSLVLVFYVIRLSKTPTRGDCIVTAVLGGIGFFLGMGIGGVLVLIGGIIGITKSGESNA